MRHMNKKISFLLLGIVLLATNNISAQFKQAPLPYAYDALEPFIDAITMEIHYSKHHAGYVAKLNKALKMSDRTPATLEAVFADISAYDEAVRNNAGGHYNHTLFWSILTPEKGTRLSAALKKAIERDFGGTEQLKEQFREAAAGRFGSGWAWLIVTPDKKLSVTSTPNQDNPLMEDAMVQGIPVLGADVWEHAYYLKYQNKRGDYLNALWKIINWKEVSRNYEEAVK